MNKHIASGRLTADPKVSYSNGDGENKISWARFTLAVARKVKVEGQPEADFCPYVAFGKMAESVEKHLKKGVKITVEGHFQTSSYTDKEGKKVYSQEFVLETWEFAESKKSGDSAPAEAQPQQNTPAPQPTPQPAPAPTPQSEPQPNYGDIDPSNLGFY